MCDSKPSDWEPLDPANNGDPTAIHAKLRSKCPVAWTNEFGGFYALTRHEDVVEAALDHETYISSEKSSIPPSAGVHRPAKPPVESDPPTHGDYRAILDRFFSPDRMHKLEPVIRRAARDLLGRCIAQGETDAVADFTFLMPVQVQCFFLGIPVEDAVLIKNLANEIIHAGMVKDHAIHTAANDRMYDYIDTMIEARVGRPRDANDVVSALLHGEVEGRPLKHDEVAGVLRLFLQAGHGTTTNALGSIIRYLATNPGDQKRLRDDPALIPRAIEEVLRFWSPVRVSGRTVSREVEVAGTTMPAGSKVALMWSSANRDDAVFDDPDMFDLDRNPNRHLAFGYGVHRCIGFPLAQAQMRIAVEELLSMTDDIKLSGEATLTLWTHIGVSKMPMKFSPRSNPVMGGIRGGHKELALVITGVKPLADRIVELELQGPGGEELLPQWEPGAHVDVVVPGEVARSYSLVGDPSDRHRYRIAVLLEQESRGGSSWLHQQEVGTEVRVRWPRNNFTFKQDAARYHFMASGIGVTPLISMIEVLRREGKPWRLDYVGRTRESLAYLEELHSLENVHVYLTAEAGRPDLDSIVANSCAETPIYACGSAPFLIALDEIARCGEREFHTEWFAPRPGARQPGEGALESFTVSLARSGFEVEVVPGESIIDACDEVGVTVPASCYEGTCGSCLSTVVEGEPDHRDSILAPEVRRTNVMMTPCVSRSKTSRLVLDL